MRSVLAAAVIAVLAIVTVMFLRDGKESSTHGPVVEAWKKHGAPETYSPETVLKIAPSTRPATPRPAPDVSKRSALALEIRDAKSWKPIYDRLRATAETPEGAYYLAMMLSTCADVTDRKSKRPPPEDARAKFVASVSPKDPQRTARLAAYDAMRQDRCAELHQVTTTEQEIKDLRARAAAGGDPKARAQQVAQEIWATANPASPPGTGFPTVTDAQIAALREVTRSADPTALQTVGSVLASTLGDLHIRAGPDEQPVDPRAFHDAWLLASCEFGANCGRDNGYLSSACAYEGRCGVDNVGDYLYFYGHSPAQSQAVGEYTRHLVNAIRNGDWSYFHFVREAPPNAASNSFRFGGPR